MKKILFSLSFLVSINSFSQLCDINKIVCDNFEKQIFKDPSIDYNNYKTYYLISTNQFLKGEDQSIQEKQLEFFLNNFIYTFCGLKFIPVSDSIEPDLLIVYDYSNDYKERYVSPKTIYLPIWNKGRTSSTKINSSSSSNLNVIGDINLLGNVRTTNSSTINTSTPGEWTITQIERPGYTVGKYFPGVSIIIYDNSNKNKIWEGIGTGSSINKDFRLAGQYIMTYLGFEIPIGSFRDEDLYLNNDGWMGLSIMPYNTEGQDFYPIITNIIDKSPAIKGGLKVDDVIISINGIPTKNITSKKIANLIKGNVGSLIKFTIERNGKTITKSIIKGKKPQTN
jgi:hypothetical protein